MGLMESPVERGRLVVTPHPILLDGQRNVPCDLRPGETLYAFLARHVDLSEQWEVSIGGVVVPVHLWLHVRPKHGQVIECRGAVSRAVLQIVALVALTYFTFGFGAGATGSLFIGSGAAIGGGALAASAAYVAGSILINRVLGPKPPSLSSSGKEQDPTHSLNGQRNAFRAYQPVPLLFGQVKITPDLSSDTPFAFYRSNEQYLALILNCGINVDRVDALYNGDALLSSFEGVEDYYSGFSGITEESIPLYSNTDSIAGGSLDSPAGTFIQRTSSVDTIRLEVDLECNVYDFDSKGKPKYNSETITAQYREVGTTTWFNLIGALFAGSAPKVQRQTLSLGVPAGQYEVQVKRDNIAGTGSGAHCDATWTTLRSVQADTGNYKGLARIGVVCKATGQLNNSLDELRCVAYSKDLEYWNGSAWVTDGTHISNPGAQILAYARGIYDEDGVLIAGMGLADEQIDLDALKGFIPHCTTNAYTYDYYLKEARSHADVLNAIALAGFGQITWAGGKLSVAWAADGQPLSGVVNMATIKRSQFQVDYTLAGGADGIEFTYLDADGYTNKTLRVSAPGVTTPLNPAQVAGEGITSEAHAAEMARYHLAQHLYQFKTVQYGTDLEHLSYRRLSLLALQHDLTQWGSGGRVQSATDDGSGIVTLTLDEPVAAPGASTPYIGLRIPGEDVYRVFQVATFTEATKVITLAETWPGDAALPGSDSDNPARDTIWIYDFKSDPGLRVRVVDIQPEAGLKGASVTVVPEDDAFWTYVKTGDYTASIPSGLPSVVPVVSNVRASEETVVQGDTTFTKINVAFDVSGRMDHAIVLVQYTDGDGDTDGVLYKLDETRTTDATFRSSGAGTYDIVVRPYSVDGIVGTAGTLSYDSSLSLIPVPENFAVTVDSGAVRRYTWSYDAGTIQPPDITGLEVAYITGHVSASLPSWDSMTQIGGVHDGHAFDSLDPPAGDWTFAYRVATTAGRESGWLYLETTLTDSLPEVATGAASDASTALTNAASALAAANDARQDAMTAVGAPVWSSSTTYASGAYASRDGVIYKSKSAGNLNHQPPNATYWDVVGSVIVTANGLAGSISTLDAQINTSGTGILDKLDAVVLEVDDPTTGLSAQGSQISSLTITLGAKPQIFYQATKPSLTGRVDGDLWIESDNKNKQWVYQASPAADFVDATDSDKVRVYAQTTEPSHTGRLEGDVWIDTDDGNKQYRWSVSASDFVETTDSRVADSVTRIDALLLRTDDPTTGLEATFSYVDEINLQINTAGTGIASKVTVLEGTVSDPTTGLVDRVAVVESWETNLDILYAEWSVTLDVNGYVSGVTSVNDGSAAGFFVKADQFKVISPGGAGYLYWETNATTTGGGGVLGMITTNKQFNVGAGFGSSGKLLMHYGATGTLSSRTMSNATFAVDDDGRVKMAGLWGNFGSGWSSGAAITSSFDSATPASVTINVAAGTFFTMGKSISYSAGSGSVSQTRGTTVTYYLYYSDASMVGGAQSLGISTNYNISYNNIGYVYVGQVTVTVPASGSGGGGGGSPPCPWVESQVLVVRDGVAQRIRAGDVVVGDHLPGWDDAMHIASVSETVETEGVSMTDVDGKTYTCSACAQWRGVDGERIVAEKAEGRVICTADGPKGIALVERIGPILVQRITAANGWYMAGDDRLAYHHNIKVGP